MSLVITRGFGRSKINTIDAGPVTAGFGRTKILVPTRILEPGHIDSRPLLFPPDVYTGAIPTDIPLIDASATIHLPVLDQFRALDIIYMKLGIRQLAESLLSVYGMSIKFRLGLLGEYQADIGIRDHMNIKFSEGFVGSVE